MHRQQSGSLLEGRGDWWVVSRITLWGTFVILGAGALGLGVAFDAEAQVYRFTDRRGVVHLTNVPRDHRYEVYVARSNVIRMSSVDSKRVPKLPGSTGYDAVIRRASAQHRLEPALVKAVIAAESNFDPDAVSTQGAQGLMQLMPATARELGVRDAFAPEENVQGGALYLRQMLNRFGDLRRALAAYNAGPTAVDRYRDVPPFPETQAYVNRVLTYYLGYGMDRGR